MKYAHSRFLFAAVVLGCARVGVADIVDECVTCHGAGGNGNIALRAPKIAGLEPWYVTRQLEAFASGARGAQAQDAPGQLMRAIAVRLQQEGKMDAAVQFVASLTPQAQSPTVSGDVENGRRIFGGCTGCHGLAGEGMPDMKAPPLAGRTDWYLLAQLRNFKQGLRGGGTADNYATQMQAAAATLPDDKAVIDVVAFINTLE